jgi:hypothetical protein
VVGNLAELKSLDASQLVYLGFHENLAVENLRKFVDLIPLPILREGFRQKKFLDHLTLSWMWGNPDLVFEEPLREGHYLAYPVEIR